MIKHLLLTLSILSAVACTGPNKASEPLVVVPAGPVAYSDPVVMNWAFGNNNGDSEASNLIHWNPLLGISSGGSQNLHYEMEIPINIMNSDLDGYVYFSVGGNYGNAPDLYFQLSNYSSEPINGGFKKYVRLVLDNTTNHTGHPLKTKYEFDIIIYRPSATGVRTPAFNLTKHLVVVTN